MGARSPIDWVLEAVKNDDQSCRAGMVQVLEAAQRPAVHHLAHAIAGLELALFMTAFRSDGNAGLPR